MNKETPATERTPPSDLPGEEFVKWAIQDKQTPVVMFSLSWCGYCRAAKDLLNKLGIRYTVHEVDSSRFRENDSQRAVRQALQSITHSSTLPQVFIGGELVGGYTETHAAFQNGKLRDLLARHGVESSLAARD